MPLTAEALRLLLSGKALKLPSIGRIITSSQPWRTAWFNNLSPGSYSAAISWSNRGKVLGEVPIAVFDFLTGKGRVQAPKWESMFASTPSIWSSFPNGGDPVLNTALRKEAFLIYLQMPHKDFFFTPTGKFDIQGQPIFTLNLLNFPIPSLYEFIKMMSQKPDGRHVILDPANVNGNTPVFKRTAGSRFSILTDDVFDIHPFQNPNRIAGSLPKPIRDLMFRTIHNPEGSEFAESYELLPLMEKYRDLELGLISGGRPFRVTTEFTGSLLPDEHYQADVSDAELARIKLNLIDRAVEDSVDISMGQLAETGELDSMTQEQMKEWLEKEYAITTPKVEEYVNSLPKEELLTKSDAPTTAPIDLHSRIGGINYPRSLWNGYTPGVRLKSKTFNLEKVEDPTIAARIGSEDEFLAHMYTPYMGISGLVDLERRAIPNLQLSDRAKSFFDDAIFQERLKVARELVYSHLTGSLNRPDKNTNLSKIRKTPEAEELLKLKYGEEYSEQLRQLLGESFNPVNGTWNRDPEVIAKLLGSDKDTLLEFYKLLEDYKPAETTKTFSDLILKNPDALDQMQNGTYVGMHDAITHNRYGEGKSLIKRARLSLTGLGDLGHVTNHPSFGHNFSVNSIIVNLRGIEKEINRRLQQRLLPVIATKAAETLATLNKQGKVKFIGKDGTPTAYISSYTDDKPLYAWRNWGKSGDYPVMIDPDTGEPATRMGNKHYVYRPSLQELTAEGFLSIEDHLDAIRRLYARTIEAYNRQIDMYPNLFDESDRILFDPNDIQIVPGDINSPEYEDRIPTIVGPEYIFRMQSGGKLNTFKL